MNLRYMVDYALRDRIPAYRHGVAVAGRCEPRYEPVGVWVQGPGPSLDLVIESLPGNTEAREEAEWIVNRLVENEVRTLADDFLAYHQATLSPYRGMRGPVVETDEYPSAEACARAVLDKILSGRIS